MERKWLRVLIYPVVLTTLAATTWRREEVLAQR